MNDGQRPVRVRVWQLLVLVFAVWLAWAAGTYVVGVVFLRSTLALIYAVIFGGLAVAGLGLIVHAAVTGRFFKVVGNPPSDAISVGAYLRGYFRTLGGHYRMAGSTIYSALKRLFRHADPRGPKGK